MIRSIRWKVTVAYNSAWMLLLLAAVSGYTQPVRESVIQKKITLQSGNLSAETVLQRIEALAQVHFVYSPSLIELNKPLSVSFYDRPLREVLDALGKQLGLELKMQGTYVILKKLANPLPFIANSPPVASRLARPVVMAEVPLPVYMPEPEYEDSLISYRKLKRSLLGGKSDFGLDTVFLRRYLNQPVHNVLKPSTHTQWFVSVSAFANDYSVGTEVRAGVRMLYAVANTGYMRSGDFRNGLGVGSTVNIKPGIRLSPIYTYGRMKSTEDLNAYSKLLVTSRHHQFKMLVSFAVTNRLSFQIGPSLNVLRSRYDFQREVIHRQVVLIHQTRGQSTTGNAGWSETSGLQGAVPPSEPGFTPGENISFSAKPTGTATPHSFDCNAVRSWVGFETGITYSINFYHRP